MKKTRLVSAALAVAMAAAVFSGCGAKKDTAWEDPKALPKDGYEINWYFYGEPQSDTTAVEQKINEYLKDKINATVKLNRLTSSQYSQKMNAMIAAGEYYDICFTANWMLSYATTAANGAWLPLDDYLDDYMPKTKEIIGDDILNNTRVNGKIYGIPAMKEMATAKGIAYRKDIAEKYNIDMTKVKNLDDLKEILKFVQSKEPDMQYPIDWPSNDRKPTILERFEPIAASVGFECIDPENNVYSEKIIHSAFSENMEKAYYKAREFYTDGLIKKDVLTAKDFDQRLKSGKVFAYIEHLKPGKVEEVSRDFSFKLGAVQLTNPVMDRNAGTGSMMSVSAKSKNPARAMKFLELMNSDKYLNNLVVFGIEGKHYNKLDDNTVKVIPNSGYTLSESQWMMGNVFLNYLTEGENPDKIQLLKEFNKEATNPCFYGFVFDSTPVQQQIAAVKTVEEQYAALVSCGATDVEPTLTEFREKLKKAGVQDIIDEVQKQYDAFKAKK